MEKKSAMADMKHLFKTATAVSGSSSAEKGWIDTNTYWKTTMNPFTLENGVSPG